MKKHIGFVLIVLFYSTGVAQNYRPMFSELNEWQFLNCFQGDCDLVDTYFTDGDTIVNNKSYKILDGHHYIARNFLFREDISQRKVYLTTIINNSLREYLLYDFSLEVGEEIEMFNPISPFPENGGMFTLTSIEIQPLTDGNFYKHFYFSPSPENTTSSWNAVWIEGVGSLSLINAPGGEPDFDGVGAVCCSFADGENIYSNTERIETCNPNILEAEEEELFPEIEIYNYDGSIYIRNALAVKQLSIYDLQGRSLLSKKYDSTSTITISSEGWRDSVYFMLVKGTKNKTKIFKIITR